MKRKIALLLVLVLCLGLTACGQGDVSRVQVEIKGSAMYSEEELWDATDVVLEFFQQEMAGCTLNQLTYNEKFSANEALEWAEQYKAEQAIVLYSNFDTDSGRSFPTLESGANYAWKWILTRSGAERWKLQTWGYG